ncbi:MAG TPA: hypothetical protein PK781_06920 [Terrimesophilobacter sp.]|nr:hypothetical protein [Terrimesophilobacter sp.]HRQ00177.1 hypothetical protein [Terrimesophilobacter sp.]
MRASRIHRLLLFGLLAAVVVSGCGMLAPVGSKTDTVARELIGMPGVIAVEGSVRELHLTQPRRSVLWVDLDPAVTEPEVLDILTAFDAVNRRTGVEPVSSTLNLSIDHASPLDTDRLKLDFDAPSPQQLAGLAGAWFDLRERFVGADVGLIDYHLGEPQVGFEVTINMPEHFDAVDDLAALRHLRTLFADTGPVTKVFQVGGQFEVERSLPSESTLSLVESVLRTFGILSVHGQFWGDERVRLTTTISAESGLVDFALGVSPLMAEVVDLIPQDAPPIRLSFILGDSRDAAVYFDNEACEYYGDDQAGADSRELLSYWARDGRTLLDGSRAADCS